MSIMVITGTMAGACLGSYALLKARLCRLSTIGRFDDLLGNGKLRW